VRHDSSSRYARKPQLARELTATGEKVHSLESIIFLAVRDYRFQEERGKSDKSRDFQGSRDENDDEVRLT